MQEARFAGACQDEHAGRPVGWPGARKSIGATSRRISWWAPAECNKPRLRGLGPGLPGAWGPGLGAGASIVVLKSLLVGGRRRGGRRRLQGRKEEGFHPLRS